MALTVEDIVNQALVDLGYPARIGDIWEGSEASGAALEIYAQTRDEMLVEGAWPMATRPNVVLELLKGPPPAGGYDPNTPWNPTYPPPGWLYEYQHPDDMLELRAILWPPGGLYDRDPRSATWSIRNDDSLVDRAGAATTQKKVVLTNVPDALAVYTAPVVDLDLWEPGFIEVLVKKLAEKLARRLRAGEAVLRDIVQVSVPLRAQVEGDRG